MYEYASYYQRKRILISALACIFALFLIFLHIDSAKSAALNIGDEETSEEAAATGVTEEDLMNNNALSSFVAAADAVKKICQTGDMTTEIVDKFSLVEKIRDQAFANGLSAIASTIALSLLLIYLLIHLIRESLRGDITIDLWVRWFAVFIVSCFVLANTGDIRLGLDKGGTRIIEMISGKNTKTGDPNIQKLNLDERRIDDSLNINDDISGTNTTTGNADYENLLKQNLLSPAQILLEHGIISKIPEGMEDATKEYWDTGSLVKVSELLTDDVIHNPEYNISVIILIQMAIIRLFRIGFLCAIDAQIFTIALQLVIRGAMMPIAAVSIASDGGRGGSVRYFKRYLALYVQEVIIVVIARAFNSITLTVLEGGGSDSFGLVKIYYVITCMGALTAAIAQSGSLAQELMGD